MSCPPPLFSACRRSDATTMKRQDTGKRGEQLAREFLDMRGYQIIETNYRCPYGEMDIIAQRQDTLVFVEVRTKSSLAFGNPEESFSKTLKTTKR